MALSIYTKIDQDSVGAVDVEDYAQFVRDELATLYPAAEITIETTTRESGVMPLVIDGATADEEDEIRAELQQCWERYCSR